MIGLLTREVPVNALTSWVEAVIVSEAINYPSFPQLHISSVYARVLIAHLYFVERGRESLQWFGLSGPEASMEALSA